MDNSQFRHTLDIEGIISSRPRKREISRENSEDTLHGLSFELTSDRETRQDRSGNDYDVDPKWTMSVFDFEDEEQNALYRQVSDLRIGDRVTVKAAVIPTVRRGYPSLNLRLLGLENNAQ